VIKRLPPRSRRSRAIVIACLLASAGGAARADAPLPDPTDAGAPAPEIPATVTPLDAAGGYLRRVDAPRLPWTRLFRADGAFVPESELGAGAGAAPSPRAAAGHDHGSMTMQAAAKPSAPPATQAAGARTDARGVIRAVDQAQGKVTLKHGPIERLEMPGMTMVFRVKDKALLQGLQKGDEVGFDVEVDGTTFYVTGIAKQGAAQ